MRTRHRIWKNSSNKISHAILALKSLIIDTDLQHKKLPKIISIYWKLKFIKSHKGIDVDCINEANMKWISLVESQLEESKIQSKINR